MKDTERAVSYHDLFIESRAHGEKDIHPAPVALGDALDTAHAKWGEVAFSLYQVTIKVTLADWTRNPRTREHHIVINRADASLQDIPLRHLETDATRMAGKLPREIAFTAVARVALVAAKVKGDDGQDRRILARGKSNIGPDDGGFEYTIGQTEALPGIQASRIEWGAAVEGSARELLSDPTTEETEDGNAQDSAAAFLREVLKDDVVPVKSIEAEAKEAGIAWRTVRRASDALSVIKKRGMENRWYWSLPKLSKPGNLSKLSNVSTLDNLDDMTGNPTLSNTERACNG